jgi:RNA polymerase sigma-70 factor, ECF subfamily
MSQQADCETIHGSPGGKLAPIDATDHSLGSKAKQVAAPGDCSEELARLLCGVASQDPGAFARLYRLTSGRLFQAALLILESGDLAEALLQAAYVQIWSKAGGFDASLHSPMNWMMVIVRRLAIDYVRRHAIGSRNNTAGIDPEPSGGPTPPGAGLLAGDAQATSAPYGHPSHELQALAAVYIHGESREQLALRLGVPVDTAKALLRQTLLRLHRATD